MDVPGADFDFDNDVKHSGERSARIVFDGSQNLTYGNLFQQVLVTPGTHYRFQGYLRTDQISTDSGMRFEIYDPKDQKNLDVLTPNERGTQPWTLEEADFTTGPQTHLIRVRVFRAPSDRLDNKISGTVWVDDVEIFPRRTKAMSVIRTGICVLVAFAVLAHGGVEPWSEAVLEVGAAVLLLVWALRRRPIRTLRWSGVRLFWPLLGVWIIGAVQWGAGISMVPFLTRIELLKYSALLALFFLCLQSYRTRAQWRGFVWFLLILGFAVSLFAILQHFTFNGKLYWVREMRYGGMPFGPYVNRNHFAGLMELLIPPGMAILVLGGERRDQLPLLTLFTLLPIGALFLSASRGGIMSFFAEMGFSCHPDCFAPERKKSIGGGAILIVGLACRIGFMAGHWCRDGAVCKL